MKVLKYAHGSYEPEGLKPKSAECPTIEGGNASGTSIERVREILATVKPLAAEYYRLTGKPLGVTGEVAEYIAAEMLGLVLADARTPGYDATRQTPNGPQRIQIKGRAYANGAKPAQRISRIRTDGM